MECSIKAFENPSVFNIYVFNMFSLYSRPGQESQKVFTANYPIDTEASKVKVSKQFTLHESCHVN